MGKGDGESNKKIKIIQNKLVHKTNKHVFFKPSL